jgi:hypothetical protein
MSKFIVIIAVFIGISTVSCKSKVPVATTINKAEFHKSKKLNASKLNIKTSVDAVNFLTKNYIFKSKHDYGDNKVTTCEKFNEDSVVMRVSLIDLTALTTIDKGTMPISSGKITYGILKPSKHHKYHVVVLTIPIQAKIKGPSNNSHYSASCVILQNKSPNLELEKISLALDRIGVQQSLILKE